MEGTPANPRSPWCSLRRTTDGRQVVVRGLRWADTEGVRNATDHLRRQNKERDLKTLALELAEIASNGVVETRVVAQTWGEVRALVKQAIAPGGEKEKDRNPFTAFGDRGHFGQLFADDAVALSKDLEQWALYTPESIRAHKRNGTPLLPRRYGSSVFHGCVQAVNWLAGKKVAIATPELQERLEELKKDREDPRPDFIPRDSDLEAWLDQVQAWDELMGWALAMIATYGLRPHEVWHLTRLPGEVEGQPLMIQIGYQTLNKKNQTTKTGHRFAQALPESWVQRYRLDDLERSRNLCAALKRRWKPSKSVGNIVSHWLRDSARPDREIPAKLMGYYRPDPSEETPRPRERKGRSTAYDMRHRWAMRCLELKPQWPAELKAKLMGHSTAIHTRTYLRSVTEQQKLSEIRELLGQAEQQASQQQKRAPVEPREEVVEVLPAEVQQKLKKLARLEALMAD